eukprot:scaffold1741_cov262-Pinguiococcus_pyrenoidosus.AAC.17
MSEGSSPSWRILRCHFTFGGLAARLSPCALTVLALSGALRLLRVQKRIVVVVTAARRRSGGGCSRTDTASGDSLGLGRARLHALRCAAPVPAPSRQLDSSILPGRRAVRGGSPLGRRQRRHRSSSGSTLRAVVISRERGRGGSAPPLPRYQRPQPALRRHGAARSQRGAAHHKHLDGEKREASRIAGET